MTETESDTNARGGGEGGRRRGRRGSGPPADGRAGPRAARHQARILALQALYEVDVTAHPLPEVLARAFEVQDVPPPLQARVTRLVEGVVAHRDEIDPYIAEAAPAFPVAQLPVVDRNVLRLALYELLYEPDVPTKAAINEAVELAKRFGGMNSGRFVNGVLGTIVERLAGQRTADGHGDGDAAVESGGG